MKTPLVIAFVAVVFVALGTLAVMNKACKSSQHAWCAPMSSLQHHIKPHALIDFDQITGAAG
jgi:hypothetical protein